jgi:flagellar basal body-associated protein FliL
MADKDQKKPESTDKPDAPGGPASTVKKGGGGIGGLLAKTPVLLGGVMVAEAAVLLVGLKMLGFGATKQSVAAELATEEHASAEHADDGDHAEGSAAGGDGASADKGKEGGPSGANAGARKYGKKEQVEIQVVELRAPNKQSGRTFLYDISIYVVTRGEHVEKLNRTLKDREALIKDRVRTIIAQSDPEKLGGGSEPGLETLRRQVKYQLDEIVGDGLIEEVLVPRCIAFRTDY